MNGGTLSATTGVAKITVGDVTITGGDVLLGVTTTKGVLICDGLVTMTGGTYDATADLTVPTATKWLANKGFVLGGTATLTVTTIAKPNPVVVGTLVTILQTPANLITGDFATKNVAIPGTTNSYNAAPNGTKQFYDLTVK